jgi:hypothetical protein
MLVIPECKFTPKFKKKLFLGFSSDNKVYSQIENEDILKKSMADALEEYNADTPTPMHLVLFLDAIEHVSRISRVLRQPQVFHQNIFSLFFLFLQRVFWLFFLQKHLYIKISFYFQTKN